MALDTDQTAWSCYSSSAEQSAVDSNPSPAPTWHSYGDVLGTKYLYDSNVAYSKQIKPGDLLVIRDASDVLGFGYVSHITSAAGSKNIRRCPQCGRGGPEPRKTLQPRYRCGGCHAEFEEPALTTETVEVFEAYYAETWCELSQPIARATLDALYLNRSTQNAIRPLDMRGLESLLQRAAPLSAVMQFVEGQPNRAVTLPGGHRIASIRARIGQRAFRESMLNRYGSVCAISGPQPPEALHAAHLYVYADIGSHDVEGGLLLRADLHTLFDNFRLAIDPATWTIRIDPTLCTFPHLAALTGTEIQAAPHRRPNPEYLRAHLDSALARWAATTPPAGPD